MAPAMRPQRSSVSVNGASGDLSQACSRSITRAVIAASSAGEGGLAASKSTASSRARSSGAPYSRASDSIRRRSIPGPVSFDWAATSRR